MRANTTDGVDIDTIIVYGTIYVNLAVLPAVARAVHQRVQSPIEQTVFSLHGPDPHGTRRVVNPAASVGPAEPAEVFVRFRRPPFAAPLGTRHPEHGHQISLPATAETVERWATTTN